MTTLRTLLDELYAVDPSLRTHEATLTPVLESLLRTKPEVTIDETFIATLRQTLMTKPAPAPRRIDWRLLFPAVGIAAIALVVALPFTQPQPGSRMAVTSLASNAFGMLGAAQASGTGGGGGGDAKRMAGDTPATSETSIMVGEPYPNSVRYTYAYDGDIALTETAGTVYRRSGALALPGSTQNTLKNMNLGTVDLGAFGDLGAQYITLRQDDVNGYNVSLDLMYGMISINTNEGMWSTLESYPQLTEATMPSEEDVVTTAATFLSRYGISTEGYGDAIVSKAAYGYILDLARSATGYVPDSMTVSWPVMVNGMPVLHSDGSGYGITVGVNLRANTVTYVSIVSTNTLDASSYTLTTDVNAVRTIVERGGMYGWQPETAEKTYNVTLGAPTQVLTIHSSYNEAERKSVDLFVPALSFPVTDAEGDMQQSSIVIPLVESILEAHAEEPIYRIMDEPVVMTEPALE